MRLRFQHAFFGIIAVLTTQVIALTFHWYFYQPSFDIPMHFAGGFVMAMLAIALQHEFLDLYKLKSAAWWHELLFVLGFVALIAIGWEFFEFVVDSFWGRDSGFVSQISLQDTMGDFALGLLGAITAHLLFRPNKK